MGSRAAGFAVVDIETTGFSASSDRVVEIGVALLEPDGTESASFTTLIDAGVGAGPTHVHGISDAMLEGAPSFGEVAEHLTGLFEGRVLVGHNLVAFDLPFVRAEFARALGGDRWPAHVATVDTLRIAQQHLGLYGRARLEACCTHFGLEWEDHHHALGDAVVTGRLLGAMRRVLGDERSGVAEALDAAVGVPWRAMCQQVEQLGLFATDAADRRPPPRTGTEPRVQLRPAAALA